MTIEERATRYANTSTIHKLSDSWYIRKSAYINGATEQRAIDTDKASHWLLENLDFGTPAYRERFVKDFIEAMEED